MKTLAASSGIVVALVALHPAELPPPSGSPQRVKAVAKASSRPNPYKSKTGGLLSALRKPLEIAGIATRAVPVEVRAELESVFGDQKPAFTRVKSLATHELNRL